MSISLQKSTRTCKVDTASAARIESDRFLNPKNVVCPTWSGRDLAGRQVSADSFYTKRAGCNSAEDRVMVENSLRPQYVEYINLDSQGIRGQLYENNGYYQDAGHHYAAMKDIEKVTGHFGGVVSGGQRQVSCNSGKNYDAEAIGVRQMERQVALNNSRSKGPSCLSKLVLPEQVGSQIRNTVEGFTDDRMSAPKNIQRKMAAVNSGYRSCKFTTASGF